MPVWSRIDRALKRAPRAPWPRKTNYEKPQQENPDKQDTPPSLEALNLQSIDNYEGKLREEATRKVPGGGRVSKEWYKVVQEFDEWLEGYDDRAMQVENQAGDRVSFPLETSYHSAYARRMYAKLKTLEEQVASEWDDPHVVMLTRTTSKTDADGNPRPPAEHLRELKESWKPMYDKLRYTFRDDRMEYATIMEPHKDGYAHAHVAVFVDRPVDVEDFEGIMEAHVEACTNAGEKAHDPANGAVSVNANIKDTDDLGNCASYLAEYMNLYEDPEAGPDGEDAVVDEAPEDARHIKRFYALCWATATQRVRFSQGANEIVREAWSDDEEEDNVEGNRATVPADDPRDVFELWEQAKDPDVDVVEVCRCEIRGGEGLTLFECARWEIVDCDHWQTFRWVELDDEGNVTEEGDEFTPEYTDPMMELRPPGREVYEHQPPDAHEEGDLFDLADVEAEPGTLRRVWQFENPLTLDEIDREQQALPEPTAQEKRERAMRQKIEHELRLDDERAELPEQIDRDDAPELDAREPVEKRLNLPDELLTEPTEPPAYSDLYRA